MTFSIVAVDPEKKDIGFAIASCFWDSGQMGFAKAEKGAVVSQAQGNWDLINIFFEKLDENMTLEEIVEAFKRADESIENRQVGMVTFSGETLAFTGGKVFNGFQRIGSNYACQGNILVGPEVIDSMVESFEKSEGTLSERLYKSLQAGDDAGGDMRGKISARVCVVRNRGNPLIETVTDFRVEEHTEPVREIGRLIQLRKNLLKTWELTQSATKAEGVEKVAAIQSLEDFLSDKNDRLYLDFHESLAELHLKVGNRDKAIERYKLYVKISPNMLSILDEEIRRDI